MESKKFCKYCGEQIDKSSIVCPKCGRQIKNPKVNENVKPDISDTNSQNTINFYEQTWFMWVMLILFAPVGVFFMWRFHPEIKNKNKIILTILFAIFFLIIIISSNNETNNNSGTNTNYKINKKAEVQVIDFSSMERTSISSWCSEAKINCNIIEEYSDTIAKGLFVSQSVSANTKIYEGDRIKIVFSLGKKPPVEYTNALKKAESYSNIMHMSKKAIYKQLISEYGENFEKDAAQYAIDNIVADWNANALAKAKSYQDNMHMSKNAIYEQLISEYGEQFTKEEAKYAIDHLDN